MGPSDTRFETATMSWFATSTTRTTTKRRLLLFWFLFIDALSCCIGSSSAFTTFDYHHHHDAIIAIHHNHNHHKHRDHFHDYQGQRSHHNNPAISRSLPPTHLSCNTSPAPIPRTTTTAIFLQLRGGGGGSLTTNLYMVFMGIQGLLLLLAPSNDLMQKFFYKIPESHKEEAKTLSTDLLQVVGSVTLGVALMLLTLLQSKLPADTATTSRSTATIMKQQAAIGISLLPRLVVIGSKLWTKYPTQMLTTNTIITAFATCSLMIGRGNLACKVFPTMSLLKALFLRLSPEQASKKFFGVSNIDSFEMKQSKGLLRVLSNELITSSVLMLLVGVASMDIHQAAGWTSIVGLILLLDTAFAWKLPMDATKGSWVHVMHIIMYAFMAAGFYLGW